MKGIIKEGKRKIHARLGYMLMLSVRAGSASRPHVLCGAEMGGGSLAALLIGGTTMGNKDCAEVGCGANAVAEHVSVCASTGAEAGAEAEVAPVSSEMSLSKTGLPERNLPAVSEGSIEGAGGKMSDWKELD